MYATETATCIECDGAGEFTDLEHDGLGGYRDVTHTCGACEGTGLEACESCGSRDSTGVQHLGDESYHFCPRCVH